MKILYVASSGDYTNTWQKTKREHSPDYYLTYLPIVNFANEYGHSVVPFWVDEEILSKGRAGMNLALRDAMIDGNYDVCLVFGGEEDFDTKVLAEIKEKTRATTVYFCSDDSWRLDSKSKYFAPFYTWVVTYYPPAVAAYRAMGITNVIFCYVWVNLEICHPVPGPKDIDVSFVGTWSKPRQKAIDALRRAGIDVMVRGNGWPEGGVPQEEMVRIFSQSKIGLSLNPPAFYFGVKPLVRLFFRRARLGEGGASIKWDGWNFYSNVREWLQKRRPQMKGRHYEIAAFGTMEMTQYAEGLEGCYELGKEIVLYGDLDDLVQRKLDITSRIPTSANVSRARVMSGPSAITACESDFQICSPRSATRSRRKMKAPRDGVSARRIFYFQAISKSLQSSAWRTGFAASMEASPTFHG